MAKRILSPDQKMSILRKHLIDGVPVSDICDEYKIHATQYYSWQKALFENGGQVFFRKKNQANERRQQEANERKIAELEAKIQRKNEVVSELLEEHVQLKKANGEP